MFLFSADASKSVRYFCAMSLFYIKVSIFATSICDYFKIFYIYFEKKYAVPSEEEKIFDFFLKTYLQKGENVVEYNPYVTVCTVCG